MASRASAAACAIALGIAPAHISLGAHGSTSDGDGASPAGTASAAEAGGGARLAQAAAPADSVSVTEWLDRLERSGASAADFSAGVTTEKVDALSDDREIRRGRVVVDGLPGAKRRIAVLLEEYIDGSGRGSAENRLFLYADGWLLEFDPARKRLTRRQVVREGESIDPLKVGEGPFPVPLGQPKADVLREFEVAACAMPDAPLFKRLAERSGELFALSLVPRPGRPMARDTKRIIVAYERSTLAPVAIEMESDAGDVTRVLLREPRINAGLDDAKRALLTPPEFDPKEWTIDSRPLAPAQPGQAQPGAAQPGPVQKPDAPPADPPAQPGAAQPGPVEPPAAERQQGDGAARAGVAALPASVRAAIEAEWLTPDERREARIFHGVWTEQDLLQPIDRARAACIAGDASMAPDAAWPATLRARLHLLRGEPDAALAALTDLAGPEGSMLRARALEAMGRTKEAAASAREGLRDAVERKARTPQELTAAACAIQVMLRLTPHDADAWRAAMDALSAARTEDRLYWPARLAEAEVLVEKHNAQEGMAAAKEAASVCPRSGEAALAIGRLALMRFDFDAADRVARAIDEAVASVQGTAAPRPGSAPLATLLRAESALLRGDPDAAIDILAPLRAALPTHREAIALEAAAHAIRWDDRAMRESLELHDSLSPGSGRAHLAAGEALAMARQYGAAAELLEEAARREPAWSAPRNSLGLLEMQSGRDDRALAALREAAALDPYEKRVGFSLYLMEEMAGWETLETPHFRIRYRSGPDAVLARDMAAGLEAVHMEVSGRFSHEPARKTTIELLPDHQFFGVRITGMPWIHTVAASTGPVIALEPPREGAAGKHLGRFDWLDTVRHEYVHTVTLDRTANRIPHWLTEAAAVDMEHTVRDWDTHELLARALDQGELFDLDEIKWAFVRPKRKTDRSLAYAQGHWMVEFMREIHGADALPRLLARYERGESEAQALQAVLGLTREQFMGDFLAWAKGKVRAWGLDPQPPLEEILPKRDAASAPLSDAEVAALLEAHPEHPDVIEIAARRAVAAVDAKPEGERQMGERERALLGRLSIARALDPWPHQRLAQDALERGDDAAAAPHLEFLDARADDEPSYALELARIARAAGRARDALAHADKASRIDPYHAATRELAAAIAIEATDLAAARRHVAALVTLEPDVERHRQRLARVDELMAASR